MKISRKVIDPILIVKNQKIQVDKFKKKMKFKRTVVKKIRIKFYKMKIRLVILIKK
jgi:hypothetical protein